jgi:putative RNA 2'-phosphotransferase
MKPEKQSKQLSRFLHYILGRSPDEFGLFLNNDGWCKVKHVLQVLSEEAGWKHIRLGNIREIFHLTSDHGLEMENDCIRSVDRSLLPKSEFVEVLPKLLYTCVRQRAYAHVLKKGIAPLGGKEYVIMTSDKLLAQRIGNRIDQRAITLTVHTNNHIDNGGYIEKYGETLFITEYVLPDCFFGPPLAEDQNTVKKELKKKHVRDAKIKPHETYGSFFPKLEEKQTEKETRKHQSKKEISWKKERRQKKRR